MMEQASPPPVTGYPVSLEDIEARVKALEALLIEKGFISTDAIDQVVRAYEQDIGPLLGAKVIARAWKDSDFKQRLLEDTGAACAELGVGGLGGEHLQALENSAEVHNVVVCTLCSCYPWPVLGLPPTWYKYPAYRSKMVIEPRKTLSEEFGLEIDDTVEIRVWDSSAEIRYFVVPERPPGSEQLSEEQLASLVTRDAMIGVARPEAT